MSVTIKSHWLYRSATEFFAKELGLQDCTIEVRVVPNRTLADGVKAACYRLDDGHYLIKLSRNMWYHSEEPAREVLAHEMIHVQQYEQGRLEDIYIFSKGLFYTFWDGKNYGAEEEGICEEYWQYPWEVDAYARQTELYERWLNR